MPLRKKGGSVEIRFGKFVLRCRNCLRWARQKKEKHPAAAAGVVVAIIGGLLKATALTSTFPEPWDVYGNLVLFLGMLLIIYDIARGGLYD